jgi:predicted TIM-barrel fold metal-dependent hydrolase
MKIDVDFEPIIEPDLPIVDAHHHLWLLREEALVEMENRDSIYAPALAPAFRRHARYLFAELLTDLKSGHNIRATVFVNAGAMYRTTGPEAMKSVGEVEFVNGVAAMSASGLFGEPRACAGIVGGVNLSLGEQVEEVLVAHLKAGGNRYRGVRSAQVVAHDEDWRILGPGVGVPHLLLDSQFRAGVERLRPLNLSLDVWLLEPQLPELIDLARTFTDTSIILNHVGTPIGIGRYAGKREERFPVWRENIRALATCSNVTVKLGGLGLPFGGFASFMSTPAVTSTQLADEWKPYIESCIESFGADRCMFESNFPVDSASGTYPLIWNAFKRLSAGASMHEKRALFGGTATRVYRLEY